MSKAKELFEIKKGRGTLDIKIKSIEIGKIYYLHRQVTNYNGYKCLFIKGLKCILRENSRNFYSDCMIGSVYCSPVIHIGIIEGGYFNSKRTIVNYGRKHKKALERAVELLEDI